MKIAAKIWNSGWGAVILTVYAALSLHLLFPRTFLLKLLSLIPAIGVMFIADQYSTRLIFFWAGGELRRSIEEIEEITGEADFYESASEEVQTRVDKLDRHAYQSNISILAGITIALTAPFVGFFVHSVPGTVAGIFIAVAALHLLTRKSIAQIKDLARNIDKPYEAKYENQ